MRILALALACAVAMIGSFFATSYLFPGGTRSAKTGQALLADLIDCRKASAATCAPVARDLAAAILDGDTGFTFKSAKGKYGVYLASGNVLYVRTNCAPTDVSDDYFALNVWPLDDAELSAARRQFGFASGDFSFKKNGYHVDKYCLAIAPLPTQTVKKIETGQFVSGRGFLWKVEM